MVVVFKIVVVAVIASWAFSFAVVVAYTEIAAAVTVQRTGSAARLIKVIAEQFVVSPFGPTPASDCFGFCHVASPGSVGLDTLNRWQHLRGVGDQLVRFEQAQASVFVFCHALA